MEKALLSMTQNSKAINKKDGSHCQGQILAAREGVPGTSMKEKH
jgi:hypothetical protein